MSDRLHVYTLNADEHAGLKRLAEIAVLRARGWGYEDIAAKLGIEWKYVRPFVIRPEEK